MAHWVPKKGYIAVLKIGGVPTYVHWSFVVYGLVVMAFLGRWSISALAASALGYLLLVLTHEAGHAFFALRAKVPVHAMVITGAGGVCYSGIPEAPFSRLLLHAGGLIAQVVLLALSITYLIVFGYPELYSVKCFFAVVTLFNVMLFIGNVIPHRGNDGASILSSIKQIRGGP